MRTTLSTLTLSLCVLPFISQQTAAATYVVAAYGYAQSCYSVAKQNDVHNINLCNLALSEGLSERDRAAVYINRGVLKIDAGDMQGGLADADKSISTYGNLPEAYLNRGMALRALGHPKEAIASLDKSIEMGVEQMHYAYYDRAMAEEDVGEVAAAYHDYKMALQVAPGFQAAAQQIRRFRVTSAPNTNT